MEALRNVGCCFEPGACAITKTSGLVWAESARIEFFLT
jgi:hypothetical protein